MTKTSPHTELCSKSPNGKHEWDHIIFYKFCKHCQISKKRSNNDWKKERGIGIFHLH